MSERRSTLAIAAVMALVAVAALIWPHPPPTDGPPSTDEPTPLDADRPPPASTGTELDRRIQAQVHFAEASSSWLEWDVVAALYMDRAAEGGGLEDLGAASDALDRAFALAPPGIGPHMRRAALDFQLHRLDDCEASLESLERHAILLAVERDALTTLRADLAFFRGDYAAARTAYEAAVASDPAPAELFSLARLEWSTGHLPEAAALLTRADAAVDVARMEGFLALAHVALERERGDLGEAARQAARAITLRPEDAEALLLLAEIRLEQGETDAAAALVTRALARSDTPRAHEIGARVARAQGDRVAMEEHRQAATRALEQTFARFPEAVAGHALLHFLRFEDETRAVDMAEVNARARPFGESRARLALAYLRASRMEQARAEIDAVLETAWSTGETHAIAAEIFAAAGDAARAEDERRRGESLCPGITERVADLHR